MLVGSCFHDKAFRLRQRVKKSHYSDSAVRSCEIKDRWDEDQHLPGALHVFRARSARIVRTDPTTKQVLNDEEVIRVILTRPKRSPSLRQHTRGFESGINDLPIHKKGCFKYDKPSGDL